MSANEKARARAKTAGRATYQHEVIDYRPACTTCGVPLRRTVDIGRLGMWRACDCPDVAWTCFMDGWQKVKIP